MVHKGSSNKRLMLPGGTCAVYSYGKLTVAAAETPSAIAAQNYVFDLAELQKAGRLQVELPNGILSLGYFKGSASPLGHAAIYPWHLLQDRQLEVRQRQDGDIFFPAGSLGSKN